MVRVGLPGAGASWLGGVTDPGVASDIGAALADGFLSFAEALEVVKDAVADGSLTSAEFGSLETVVQNLNLTFAADDYAASALIRFAGDQLAAGLSAASLDSLVARWFLGTQLPDPTVVPTGSSTASPAVSYKAFSAPLFGTNGPSVDDVNQGIEGDCELCAALVSMVLHHPDQLRSMFRDNGNGTWGVRFYVAGNEIWETVDSRLPADSAGHPAYVNFGSASPSLWAELAEKAYAQLSATGLIGHPAVSSYANIAADPPTFVYPNLTDCEDTSYFLSSDANWILYKPVFISALASGDDLVLETGSNAATDTTHDAAGRILLQADHAFAIVGYDAATGNFIVRNPWGARAGQTWVTQFEVSMADVAKVHGDIVIDDSGTNAITVRETRRIVDGQADDLAEVTSGVANPVASLFTTTNANGAPIVRYMLQAIGSDSVNLNGAKNLATASQQAAGQVVVAASDLGKVTFTPSAASTASRSTVLLVSAGDGATWSPATRLVLDVQAARVLDHPGQGVVAAGQVTPLSSLVTLDPSVSVPISFVTILTQPGLVALNGAFNVWSDAPVGGIEVHASDFSRLTFSAPATAGAIDLRVTVYDGTGWGVWSDIVVQSAPTVAKAIQNYANGQDGATKAVADSASHAFASIDALQAMLAAGSLDALRITDSAPAAVSITGAQWANDKGAVSVMDGAFSLSIAGLSADSVLRDLDALHALANAGRLAGISIAGTGTQALAFTNAQWVADADVIAKLSGDLRVTIAMPGTHAQYTVTTGAVPSISGNGEAGSLAHVDRIAFADGTLAFDVHGDAGVAYRLYQAAFNRQPDVAGLGYQTNAMDHGLTMAQVAANFIASPEFQSMYGNVDNTGFVTLLYRNVLHRDPDAGGLAYHADHLDHGYARADVLAQFSESPENQAAVIGAIQNGMFLGAQS